MAPESAAERRDPLPGPVVPDTPGSGAGRRVAGEESVSESRRSTSKRPPTFIGCGGCDAKWTGVAAAHCAAPGCHRTFSGPTAFDKHRVGTGERGRCSDPADLVNARTGAPVLEFRDGMWRGPGMTDDAKRERGFS